jgi:asparaginyl-tRNA synthetase
MRRAPRWAGCSIPCPKKSTRSSTCATWRTCAPAGSSTPPPCGSGTRWRTRRTTFFTRTASCTFILTGADCEGAGEQFGVTTLLGNDPLQADVTLPLVEKKEISKSELKRLEKQKAKADPTKPVVEEVPGAVDYKKDFFGQRVNLTVSGQLNVETHACALCDVYTFGPTFRAEESRTYRHLSEFWMIEPEIAFADLHQDINLAEDYLKYCVEFALENCASDLEFFEGSPHGEVGLRDRLRNVLDNEFKVRERSVM